jgi:hypothetical protein
MNFMLIESLESRQFLAADPLVGASSVGIYMRHDDDTLRITTLSADNTVLIWKQGRHVRMEVSSAAFDNNGNPISSRQENMFDAKKIHKIVIDTGAGNDMVEVSGRIKSHVTVYAGQGSDTVSTGSGNDKIFGGDDLDYLVGNAGNDFIDGGDGNDRITATGGTDEIWGNTGDDRITAMTIGHIIDGGTGGDIGTFHAAPTQTTRVERFYAGSPYLVPATSLPAVQLTSVGRNSSTGKTTIDITHPRDFTFSHTLNYSTQTNTIDITLTPYQIVNNKPPYSDVYRVDASSVPAGTYDVRLYQGGKLAGLVTKATIPA